MIKNLQRRVFIAATVTLGLVATLSLWPTAASAQSIAEIKK